MNLALMFLLGLAGSLHCVQMCGPLVLGFGLSSKASAHVAYHAGRILTYSALGAAAGWLGSGMTLMGRIAGIQNTASIVGGLLMVLAGLLVGGTVQRTGLVRIGSVSRLSKIAGRLLRLASPQAKFATGLVMGFIPCGLIYGALMRSVATASPVSGAMEMAAFGVGTAGPLLALGIFSVTINRWIGLRGQGWAAVGVSMAGLALIWRGMANQMQHHMH